MEETNSVVLLDLINELCLDENYSPPLNIPSHIANLKGSWYVEHNNNCRVIYKAKDVKRLGQVKAGSTPVYTLWANK